MPPPASIVIPTRARLDYLEVALSSIAPAAAQARAEVLVIDDAGASPAVRELAARFGASYEPHATPLGLNAARNTGVERSHGELVVFVDDDVRVSSRWLDALLLAACENPDVDVFTGPITPRLEGPAPRGCGRESPPITTLELGEHDTDAVYAWGANMAIRRDALERVGPFDVSLEHGGDEQEWQERMRARSPGARVLYVAGASLEHRRAGADARLRSLARTAYVRGRAARRFDARRRLAPSLARELLTLAGCLGHVVRRRCPAALTTVAHSCGRLREALRERAARARRESTRGVHGVSENGRGAGEAPGEDFLSGTSGTVGGLDAVRREACDRAVDALELLSGRRLRLELAARHAPPLRRILVLGVRRPEHGRLADAIAAELLRSRHDVELHTCAADGRGKFENLNLLLAANAGGTPGEGGSEDGTPIHDYDWLLLIDDDVELPRGFLDRFVFLCERFSLALAQPAHRLNSHAAWPLTRRRPGSIVRETSFVEIGPVTAFARATFPVLLPFPELRMGWGLDLHWAALARDHGWRCGIVDAVAVAHRAAPAAASYARDDAVAEARSFLAERRYLSAQEAARTIATHRSW
jgi:GT2 family glycosyltransferase